MSSDFCDPSHLKTHLFKVESHPWLKEISNPPDPLFLLGSQEALLRPCFAIVGTRRPTSYGIRSAIYFARELAALGFTIVSGLARGIDSYAHRGALMAKGKTVAVLGHGLDRVYPPENWDLSREIIRQGGCLISEYSSHEPPLPHHFPERNRIISGLSLGTLIIEAAEKSGSLITARFALEQNRDLFVVPSRIDDRSFKGGNLLLQEGAKMVLKLEDVLEEIPGSYWDVKQKRDGQGPECEELEIVFREHPEGLSLADIHEFPRLKRERIQQALKLAIEAEKVIEVGPQQFVWID